ncbi:MAG: hypothetical protein QXL20_06295, partial [Candidatus Bathyarchaeia archaeon]
APETWRDWRRQRTRWSKGQIESLWKHRNLFFGGRFDLMLVLAVYDMVLMDMLLLFMRIAWLAYIILSMYQKIPYVMLLSLILYFIIEFTVITTAGILSPRKNDLKKAYLAPIMVLFYRPYYSLVRLKAYLQWAMRKKISW